MKIDNIGDLKVLLHTAHRGSLTAAAHALGITPAAASATLKRLEAQLGARLFERSTRAMRLTSQGQVLLDYATRAFELLEEGESLVTADRGGLVGTLRVAAPSDLVRTTLLPWLHEFLGAHPGVQLALSVSDRPMDVVRDEVDLAIRYGELSDSRLIARQLISAGPVLQASPSYLRGRPPIKAPKDLLQHNCLTFNRSGRRHRVWRFAQNGHWTEIRVNGDRSVDDASLAREWAIAGAGIILKSVLDSREDLTSGRLLQLLPDWDTEPYPLHVLLPSGRFIPARVRALVDFLASKFASLV
jgi:DNA-binding transcriptional LysR family regulator